MDSIESQSQEKLERNCADPTSKCFRIGDGTLNKAQFSAVGTILPLTLVQAEETLHVVKVEKAPTVDGTVEEIWDNIPEAVISLARIPQQLIDANKQYQKGKYTKKWPRVYGPIIIG